MISKNIKNTLLVTGITMAVTFGAYTSVNSYNNIVQVNAEELSGEVEVTISSLWTYGSPNWSDKKAVVFKGDKFKVEEMINVSGNNMYKLENGLYLSANTKYVSFLKENNSSKVDEANKNKSEDKYYKTTANLNLREGGSTSNKILLTIPKGQEVEMISDNGSWSKVSYKNTEGYVANNYIKVFSDIVKPKPESKPNKDENFGNTTANLNLREGGSVSNKILLTIPKGREVKIISKNGSWSKVSYAGKEGYVSNKYLKINSTGGPKPEESNPKPEKPRPEESNLKPGDSAVSLKSFETKENLNLRKGNGISHNIILTIPKGSQVTEIKREGSWSRVSYKGTEGHVSNKYLKASSGSAAKPEEPNKKPDAPLDDSKTFKPVANLNLRKGSGTSYKIILTIPKGSQVTEIKRDGSWSKVSYKGIEGYVSNKYLLEVKGEIPKPTEPEPPKPIKPEIPKPNEPDNPKPAEDEEKENLPVVLSVENMKTLYEKEDIKLIGHSVSDVGVKNIEVTLNGKSLKINRVERKDLEKLYKNYKNLDKIGFEINIEKASLLNGKNTLNVTSILKDNSSKKNIYSFSVINDSRFKIENYNNTLDYYVKKEKQTKPNLSGGNATISDIKKYMDPANFVHDETYKYMFLELSYKENDLNVNAEKLNVILKGKGVLENTGQSFLNAANESGINPFYLIAHALHETGNGRSVLARGQVIDDTYEVFGDESTIIEDSVSEENKDKLYYNMFGINAYNKNPNLWGGQRAYIENWDTVEKAIEGGAYWIGRDYINRQGNPQNTLYKMRFNVANDMYHEYARDVMWAYKQAKNIKSQFDDMEVDTELNFIVPIFK